jgi:hypothetical protein
MTIGETGKIAVLWRGDRQARTDATPANNRFHLVFGALAAVGINAEPAVYAEEFADEVRAQLSRLKACSFGSIRYPEGEIAWPWTRCCVMWPNKGSGSVPIPTSPSRWG